MKLVCLIGGASFFIGIEHKKTLIVAFLIESIRGRT